mgnify:CR=1 FL=1
MKISNASKKVLASALSAAMVVAFAPTVAFGATPGQVVTVKYDVNGLTALDGTSAPADETVQLGGTDKLEATLANVPGSIAYTFADGTAVDGWFFDVNGNGVKDSEDIEVGASNKPWLLPLRSRLLHILRLAGEAQSAKTSATSRCEKKS